MKILEISFARFSTLEWMPVNYEIKAENEEQMKIAITNILKYCSLNKPSIEEEYEILKKDIKETILEFPIINQTTL